MVVESRLRHLCSMIAEGAHARIVLSATPQRIKVKVVVTQSVGSMVSSLAIGTLLALIEAAKTARVTDRGHKHSNGDSEVCFWIEAVAPTAPAGPQQLREPTALGVREEKVDVMDREVVGSTTFKGTVQRFA